MKNVYANILHAISNNKKLLAVLIDPDKLKNTEIAELSSRLNNSMATHMFVGGSTVDELATESIVKELKLYTDLPIVLFPGDINQITDKAHALLFLSLISGREPEYLIGKHVRAVSKLKNMTLEVIPTGYILIESGIESAVQRVTQTKPILRENCQQIIDTAIAGELLGMKLIYLEAGSGAKEPISEDIIKRVKQQLKIPLIVGGGIRTKAQLMEAYEAGANVVVIGTAIEDNMSFLNELK